MLNDVIEQSFGYLDEPEYRVVDNLDIVHEWTVFDSLTIIFCYLGCKVTTKFLFFQKNTYLCMHKSKRERNEDEENVADCPLVAAMLVSIRTIAERELAER
jgi:hypothetical protein